jgi:RNA polymerase sigma factor (sigma-70 family)
MQHDEARLAEEAHELQDIASLTEASSSEAECLAAVYTANRSIAWQAFEALLCPYETQLMHFAGSLLQGRHQLAQDSYQDMMKKVWSRLRKQPFNLSPGKSFGAYLHTAIKHAAQTTLQRERRERGGPQTLSLDELQAAHPMKELSETDPGSLPSPEHLDASHFDVTALTLLSPGVVTSSHFSEIPPDITLRIEAVSPRDNDRDSRSPLLRAISHLKQPRRDCFLLARVWGLEHAEIGRLLNLTAKKVTDHNFEAKAQIKAMMSYLWWEEDGYSIYQIAAELHIPDNQVRDIIDQGRRLYKRDFERGECR